MSCGLFWYRVSAYLLPTQLQHVRTINAEHRAILNCIFGTATFWSQIMVWSFDQLQRAAHSYFLTKQQEPPPTQKKKYRLPHFNTHEMVAGTSSHSQLQWRWIQCPSQTVAYSNAPWGKCEHSLHIRELESNVLRFQGAIMTKIKDIIFWVIFLQLFWSPPGAIFRTCSSSTISMDDVEDSYL